MSTDKVKLFGAGISLRQSLMVLRDSLNGAANSAAAELVLEQFVSKYRLAGAWNPPRSFDSLDGEESLVWRPVIASLRPWLEVAAGRFRADMQHWGGLDAARREVAHSIQHSNWIELTVEQWSDWADANHLHNRRLLRFLFNVIHFFSWRIKNTRLLMSLIPDMVHVLVFSVQHPAYRCLDMSRVVFGLLNTATLSDDKSVITALLPHLNALHAHVLYDPVASLDVVTQLRFARIVGHVAFFDEQAFFVALAQLGVRPSIFDWLLNWHSEVLSQYRQLLVLQNAEETRLSAEIAARGEAPLASAVLSMRVKRSKPLFSKLSMIGFEELQRSFDTEAEQLLHEGLLQALSGIVEGINRLYHAELDRLDQQAHEDGGYSSDNSDDDSTEFQIAAIYPTTPLLLDDSEDSDDDHHGHSDDSYDEDYDEDADGHHQHHHHDHGVEVQMNVVGGGVHNHHTHQHHDHDHDHDMDDDEMDYDEMDDDESYLSDQDDSDSQPEEGDHVFPQQTVIPIFGGMQMPQVGAGMFGSNMQMQNMSDETIAQIVNSVRAQIAGMPPGVAQEVMLQMEEYVEMHRLHQLAARESGHAGHSSNCVHSHASRAKRQKKNGADAAPVVELDREALRSAFLPDTPITSILNELQRSVDSDIVFAAVDKKDEPAPSTSKAVFPPAFLAPPVRTCSKKSQRELIRRFIRSLRRVESDMCERTLQSIRDLPEAALIQAHAFLLLSWMTFGREEKLIRDNVLTLAINAINKHKHDRFLLACVGSLFRSLAQSDSVQALRTMLRVKCPHVLFEGFTRVCGTHSYATQRTDALRERRKKRLERVAKQKQWRADKEARKKAGIQFSNSDDEDDGPPTHLTYRDVQMDSSGIMFTIGNESCCTDDAGADELDADSDVDDSMFHAEHMMHRAHNDYETEVNIASGFLGTILQLIQGNVPPVTAMILKDETLIRGLVEIGARFGDDDECGNMFIMALFTLVTSIQTNGPQDPAVIEAFDNRLKHANAAQVVYRMLRAHALHDEALHSVFTLLFQLFQYPAMESSMLSNALSTAATPDMARTTSATVRLCRLHSQPIELWDKQCSAGLCSLCKWSHEPHKQQLQNIQQFMAERGASEATALLESSSLITTSGELLCAIASVAAERKQSPAGDTRVPRTDAQRKAAWNALEVSEIAAENADEQNFSAAHSSLPLPQKWRLKLRRDRHALEDAAAKKIRLPNVVEAEKPEEKAVLPPAWLHRERFEPMLPYLVDLLHVCASRAIYESSIDQSRFEPPTAAHQLQSRQRYQVARDIMMFLSMLISAQQQRSAKPADHPLPLCSESVADALIELGAVPLLGRVMCCENRELQSTASALLSVLCPYGPMRTKKTRAAEDQAVKGEMAELLMRKFEPAALVNPIATVTGPRHTLLGTSTALRWLPWRRFVDIPPPSPMFCSARDALHDELSHCDHHHHHHNLVNEEAVKNQVVPIDMARGCTNPLTLSVDDQIALMHSFHTPPDTLDGPVDEVWHVLPLGRVASRLLNEKVLTVLACQGFHLHEAESVVDAYPAAAQARLLSVQRAVQSRGAQQMFEHLTGLMPPNVQVDWLREVVDFIWHPDM